MPIYVNDFAFFEDSVFQSEAKAHAEVIKSLAGRARHLYELATGQNPLSGADPPCTPVNPDGELGVNLSGPPWGSAILHPIAWIGGIKADIPNVVGSRPLTSMANADGSVTTGLPPANPTRTIRNWSVRSRRYTPLDVEQGLISPYSRGYLAIRGWASAGTVEARIRVWQTGNDDNKRTDTVEFSSTTEAMRSPTSSPALDLYVDLAADGRNEINVEIRNNDTTDTLHISSIAILQVAKRSH